jgi:hypothetical protein
MTIAPQIRILSIDPTSKGFAWCLLESGRTLVDWGTVQVEPPHNDNCLKRVTTLLEVFRPDMVAVEDCTKGSRRSGRAPELILSIEKLARSRRVRACRIPRKSVEELFAPAKSKYDIAIALAAVFPELAPRLPRKRKPWMSEDERMNVFDAVGLALVCLYSVEAQDEDALPVISF